MTQRRIVVKELDFVVWQTFEGLQIFATASLKFGDSWENFDR